MGSFKSWGLERSFHPYNSRSCPQTYITGKLYQLIRYENQFSELVSLLANTWNLIQPLTVSNFPELPNIPQIFHESYLPRIWLFSETNELSWRTVKIEQNDRPKYFIVPQILIIIFFTQDIILAWNIVFVRGFLCQHSVLWHLRSSLTGQQSQSDWRVR